MNKTETAGGPDTVQPVQITETLADVKPQSVTADLVPFKRAEVFVSAMVAELATITQIGTTEELEAAMASLKTASEISKRIESKRTELAKPWLEGKKSLDDYAKGLVKDLPPAVDRVKALVLDYNAELERKARQLRNTDRRLQLLSLGFCTKSDEEVTSADMRFDDLVVSAVMIDGLEDGAWSALVQTMAATINERNQAAAQVAQSADEFFGEAAPAEEPAPWNEPAPIVTAPAPTMSAAPTKVKGVTARWTFEILDESQIPREYLVPDPAKIRAAIAAGSRSIPGLNVYQDKSLTIR